MAQQVNMRIQAQSTEYVPVQVTATKAGVSYNPTGDTVYFNFTATNAEPTAPAPSAGWTAGTWETAGTAYIALGLVGPGGTVLANGTYTVWVQLSDNPEQPVRNAGTVTVY